jgi:hypothetical protein
MSVAQTSRPGAAVLRRLAAFVAFICAASSASATTSGTDVSDLWWNQEESGWGVNLIHQGDILFATFFIYSDTGAPLWLHGSAIAYTGIQGGSAVYSGPIYQTSGPWFGGSFDPAGVGIRQVGTATFRFENVSSGTVIYMVDGVPVFKQISRQTWRTNNLAGTYIGAAIGTYTGCLVPGYNEDPGTVTVTQTPSALTIAFQGNGACTYTGPYTQSGRMGSVSGTFSCGNGFSGQFFGSEIEGGISAFTARATLQGEPGCTWTGRIGGLRRGS